MCKVCNIKGIITVGAVVKITRRCTTRTGIDKGAHLADKKALVLVEKVAKRGEGFYGHVIINGKLGKTLAHFRDCEFEESNYKWENEKIIQLSLI